MRLTRFLRLAASSGKKANGETGKEYRWQVSGLTWTDMKHHYCIIPMYIITIAAMGIAGSYVVRLATKHPEVSWTKRNPEPWEEYNNKQYKFLDSGRDYSKGTPKPNYKC